MTIFTYFYKIGRNWTGNWTGFRPSNPLVQLGLSQNTLNFRKKLEKFEEGQRKFFYFFRALKSKMSTNVDMTLSIDVQFPSNSPSNSVQICPNIIITTITT